MTIEGTVESVIFNNPDNGYTVLDLSTDDTDDIVTVCGVLPYVNSGDRLKLSGKWTHHKTYGRQFSAAYFEKQLPATENEILRYLSSRAVKGIGPKTAEKLVEKYGADTFDVIENHPEWLAELNGISKTKAYEISENFREQFGVRSLMMFCREYLSMAMSVRVYKKWGGASLDIIKDNPYRLCEDFSGIGFERADMLAKTIGVKPESEYRIASGIKYTLAELSRSGGHSFLPYDKLIPLASMKLGIGREAVEKTVSDMLSAGRLTRCRVQGIDAVYENAAYKCEKAIEDKLTLIDRICPRLDTGDIERLISRIELEEDKHYALLQHKAIRYAVNNGVMVLTGGPGTGKTTVIRAVIRIFESMDMNIALAAPTGRAAKRMSEATGCEAKTKSDRSHVVLCAKELAQ